MPGIIVDGKQYVLLHDKHCLKNTSLEDNVYFTLRDIFANATELEDAMQANDFNCKLTNNISYSDRTSTFKYSHVLNDVSYLHRLIDWLNTFHKDYCFEFEENEENEEEEKENEEDNQFEYMLFDDWWLQFDNLRNTLNGLL